MKRIAQRYRHYLADEMLGNKAPIQVLLIGAGGNGGPVITGLARMNHALKALGHKGIHLHVVDGDTVGPENVGRQLYSPADVGRNKAVCLVSRVNAFFGLHWQAYTVMFEEDTIESARKAKLQIVISAVDTVASRQTAYQLVKGTGMYLLDMGNTKNTGQVILGTGTYIRQPARIKESCIGHLPTTLDIWPDLKDEEKKEYQGPSCGIAEAIERQDLFINTAVSTYALDLLWSGIRKGFLEENGVFVNLATKKTNPIPINPEVWKGMGWTQDQAA